MPTELHKQRIRAVLDGLRQVEASSVLDLGCGEGELLAELLDEDRFERIVALDSCAAALLRARQRLGRALTRGDGRVQLMRGSFTNPDPALMGFDAAVLLETIEHVEPHELSRVERAVFHGYRPRVVFVTTPNRDYNALYDLGSGERRHADHRFEWTRSKFEAWSKGVAERNGYKVFFVGIGDCHPRLGCPTQMARFHADNG